MLCIMDAVIQNQVRLLCNEARGRGFTQPDGTLQVHLSGLRYAAGLKLPIGGARAKEGRLAIAVYEDARHVSILTHDDMIQSGYSRDKRVQLFLRGNRVMYDCMGVSHEISLLFGCWVAVVVEALRKGLKFSLCKLRRNQALTPDLCAGLADAANIVTVGTVSERAAAAIGEIGCVRIDYSLAVGLPPNSLLHYAWEAGAVCNVVAGMCGADFANLEDMPEMILGALGPILSNRIGVVATREHCVYLAGSIPDDLGDFHGYDMDIFSPLLGLACASRLWADKKTNVLACSDANVLMTALPARVYTGSLLADVVAGGFEAVKWNTAIRNRFLALGLVLDSEGSGDEFVLPPFGNAPLPALYELATGVAVTGRYIDDRQSRALIVRPVPSAVVRTDLVPILHGVHTAQLRVGQIVGPAVTPDGFFGRLVDVTMSPSMVQQPTYRRVLGGRNFAPFMLTLATCLLVGSDLYYNGSYSGFVAAAFVSKALPSTAVQFCYQLMHVRYGKFAVVGIHDDKWTKEFFSVLLTSVPPFSMLFEGSGAALGYGVLVLWFLVVASGMWYMVRDLVSLRVGGCFEIVDAVDHTTASGYRCTDKYDYGLSWIRGSSGFALPVGDIGHTVEGATQLDGRWIPCGHAELADSTRTSAPLSTPSQ